MPHLPIQVHAALCKPSSDQRCTTALDTNTNKRNPSTTQPITNNLACNLMHPHFVHSVNTSSRHRTKSRAHRLVPYTPRIFDRLPNIRPMRDK
jgi:hypothetical protein